MPRQKLQDFKCPRCGYTTHRMPSMRAHLYGNKKVCLAILAKIELTDDIKDMIMNRNQSITIPSSNPGTTSSTNSTNINNTTNNNITNNNNITLVVQQFFNEKPLDANLMLYSKCKNIPIESLVEKAKVACNQLGWYDLNADKVKDGHHVIKDENCKSLFNTISSSTQGKLAPIVKQPDTDLYSVYDGSVYKQKSELETMQEVIYSAKHVFFDEYERTLKIKKEDEELDADKRLRCFNILKAYYLLLHAFKIGPPNDHDSIVWDKMLQEVQYSPSRLLLTYNDFAKIVRDNTTSVTKHYNAILQEFFNKMVISVTL